MTLQQPVETKLAKGMGWRFVYDSLRDEIISLALAPGTLLDETSLAERFGLSRSPVREALIRLLGDELVVTLSNRSTIVAPIDIQTFPKYVEALDITQRMICRLAAELRSEADLVEISARQEAFRQAVQSGDYLLMSQTNKEFHMAIAQAGRNPFFTNFYERLLDQGRRMLHLHFTYLERSTDRYLLTDEHDEMIKAIRARDIARADHLGHEHTRGYRDNFIDFMRETYSSDMVLESNSFGMSKA